MNSLLGVIFIWMFVSVFTSRIYTELNRGGDIEVYPSSARLTHYHHHHSPSSRVIWSSVGDVDHFNDYHLKSIRGNREDDQGLAKTTPAIPLGKVLRALRRALVFLQRNYRDLNLDAVFATRMVEGQLKVLTGRLADESLPMTLPAIDDLQEIYELAVLAHTVSEAGVPVIEKTEPLYFMGLGRLLESGFWELDYPTRKTDPNLVYPVVVADEILNESISDECMTEMLGTRKHKGRPCSPSDRCWDVMSRSQSSRYSLTHQILFLQVGELMGCTDVMKSLAKRRNHDTIWSMQEKFCSNVLREMQENFADGLPEEKQDLFMEQAAVCGMYGYSDLFTMDWLDVILSWQKAEGCYGYSDKRRGVRYESHKVKREEKKLSDGCLAHKTAVAVAALTLYVRYLIEDPLLSIVDPLNGI